MKYECELIHEILEQRGHKKSSLHYQSECVKSWVDETKGAYPKLCDYESEWLNYICENPIGEFPYETVTTNNTATVNHVVPLAYKSAILKGNTLVNINRPITRNDSMKVENGLQILTTWTTGYNLWMVDDITLFKTNTKYYIIVEVIHNTLTSTWSPMVGSNDCVFSGGIPSLSFASGETGIKRATFITNSDFTNVRCGLRSATGTNETVGSILKFRIAIIEYQDGMENWDIPYFEGMQSVKIPVLTTSNEDGTKTNILTVNEDVTLRGIGDAQDKLDCLTGEVTESIGVIVLDGTQYMDSDGYGVYIQVNDVKRFLDYTDKIACDKLPVIPTYRELENVENGISGFANSDSYLGQNWLYVKINNSVNTDEVKEWLTQKPITVQYQLAQESIKTVDLTVVNQDGEPLSKIKPIEGTMHVEVSGTPINPTAVLEVPVEAITQNLNSFIEGE